MATRTWDGSTDNTWDDAANWDTGRPVDGDDVVFQLAGITNRCAVGPALPVSLNSITVTNGYGGGTSSDICFANITVALLTVDDDEGIVNGGTITIANFTRNGVIGLYPYINAGLIGTVNAEADFFRFIGGTTTTANMYPTTSQQVTATTITTLNCYTDNGGYVYITSGNITTVNGYCRIVQTGATITTMHIWDATSELRAVANIVTDVYVYCNLGVDWTAPAKFGLSLIQVALGFYQGNGIHLAAPNLTLYDYDTGEAICDTTSIAPFAEGVW